MTWRQEAACRGENPDWWFETDLRSTGRAQALAICESCPVRVECLEEALEEERDACFRDFLGIRGGVPANARRHLVRDRRLAS